jgi:hypothetical protein
MMVEVQSFPGGSKVRILAEAILPPQIGPHALEREPILREHPLSILREERDLCTKRRILIQREGAFVTALRGRWTRVVR